MKNVRLCILFLAVFVALGLQAQTDNAQSFDNAQFTMHNSQLLDSLENLERPENLDRLERSDHLASHDAKDSLKIARQLKREERALARANFKPDPNKSLWLALTFPGAGQVYNRKYWKLPIIYGGAVGVTYAITYYGGHYRDYMQGYRDYLDSDPNTNYHLELLPDGYPESSAGTYVKNRVNSYRRFRDIFIVVGVAVYALSVIDAYVDAQLADFDISTDLSMKVRPKLDVEPMTNTPTAGCQMQIYF